MQKKLIKQFGQKFNLFSTFATCNTLCHKLIFLSQILFVRQSPQLGKLKCLILCLLILLPFQPLFIHL
jgi:hypothetical protein